MQKSQRELIIQRLSPLDIMLEWGSGGSTIEFSNFVDKYYSIEHDEEWYEKVKGESKDNTFIYLVKPNKKKWEKPVKRKQFKNYVEFVHKIVKEHKILKFDKVLIDGRARNYCAEEVVKYLHRDSLVFVHDWQRLRYRKMLKYLKVIETDEKGKLAILKKL